MKRILFILLLAGSFSAAIAEQYDLQQCVTTALHNNLQVRSQENSFQAQRLLYQQARQNLLPSLSGYASQSWSWGRSTGADNITLSQNIANTNLGLNANLILFDGLAMKFRIDEAKAQANRSEAELAELKLDITMNITAMFLQVMLNKELEQLAQSQLQYTQLKIERIEALVTANRLAQGELYTIQAQAAKEQNNLIQAQNTTKLSLLDLAQAMEIPYSADFDIITPQDIELNNALLLNNDEVYQYALANRPEIKAALYNLDAQQIALKTAKAAYSPTLSLGAGLGTGYFHMYGTQNTSFGKQLSDNFSSNVGLNLSIPIFDRMQTPNNIKRQQINISNAQLNLEQTKKDLRKEIDQAYYNATAAQSRQLSTQKALQSAQEAYRYAEQKYDAGRATTYEFYEAKRTLLEAQSEQLQAKYNYLFRIRILQYYAGK